MENTKDKMTVNVALSAHTYELFKATMKLTNVRRAKLLKNIIGCAIADYYGDKEHDFSRITKEMMEAKRPYRISSTVNRTEYETLKTMMQELNIEALPQLLRRFCDYILVDYFVDLNGLPVVKMPDEPVSIDVVVE